MKSGISSSTGEATKVDYLHGYVIATEIHLQKVHHVVPRPHLQFVCSQSPVLAYTSFQVDNVLVESAQQGFVFTAEALIGIGNKLLRKSRQI